MSFLVEFREFQGLSNDHFMMELDKILIASLEKLKNAKDLRRRVLLYPIFDKLIKYRTVDDDEPEEQQEPMEEETY